MKSVFKIVFVIVVIGLIDTVFSDGDIDAHVEDTLTKQDPPATSPRRCPLPSDEETNQVRRLRVLQDRLSTCSLEINEVHFKPILRQPINNEKVLKDITNYCKLLPAAEDCNADVSSQGEFCLNSTQNQILKSTAELAINFLRVGCRDNGRHLAMVVNAVKELVPIDSPTIAVIERCVRDATRGYEDDHDPTIFSKVLYNIVKSIKNCIKERVVGFEEAKSTFDVLITDLLNTMKCVGQDGGQVACETDNES